MIPGDWFAVVLAGGRGTRFWPLSRRALPKQCLSLDGGPTLLERTIARTQLPKERILADAVRPLAGGAELLVEPSARDTAAAVTWAACEVQRRGGVGCVVLPSDHVIADEEAWRDAVGHARRAAEDDTLVTLGVRPTRAETGFGWIEHDLGPGPAHPVRRFVEKPPRAVAEALLASGRHLWNGGMFVWSCVALLDAVSRHLPGAAAMVDALRRGRPIQAAWGACEATSIDYGVLEREPRLQVVPTECGWSDVGSWPALTEILPEGEGGVVVSSATVALRSRGNVVHAPGKLVALLGVEDVVVVDTPDALLVARRGEAQDVKGLLAELERRGLGRWG